MGFFFDSIFSTWYGITIFIIICVIIWLFLSMILYKHFFKRFYDIVLSLIAIICFSPLLLTIIIISTIKMKGNPFFTQLRPGKNEEIFKLIKFRTMTNEKDENGNLLPDDVRLTRYGKILRSTSLDELPELFNILIGNMSIVGPRPLLVQYLELYNEEQKHRHDVRPGLTGLAQVNGRNAISWEQKFSYDIEYVQNVTMIRDVKIIYLTILKVLKRSEISSDTSETMEYFEGSKKE